MKNINNKGFTVIEIVAVLIIFSVLSAMVMERLGSMDLFKLKSAADAVESHLRYIQLRSMTSDDVFGVNFTSGGYSAFSYNAVDGETVVNFPGIGQVNLSDNGVSLSIGGSASGTVSYDGYGRPFTDNAATTAQVGSRFIEVSAGGEYVHVEITEETGFIP